MLSNSKENFRHSSYVRVKICLRTNDAH